MKFRRHNVRLSDGSLTIPQAKPLSEAESIQSAVRFLGDVHHKSILDLGCMEGGFACEFANLGAHAVGVEIREKHFERCLFLQGQYKGPGSLWFHNCLVEDLPEMGTFDLIFCSGILYHVEKPFALLRQLAELGSAAYVHTHYAPEPGEEPARFKRHFGPVEENEGFRGRWYQEYESEKAFRDRRDASDKAAYATNRSFWPLHSELVLMFRTAGFYLAAQQIPRKRFSAPCRVAYYLVR